MQTIVIPNRRESPCGRVCLVKVDCCCPTRRLAGARFDLLWRDPCSGVYHPCRRGLTTGPDGTLEAADLTPGRYRFAEVCPPPGYRLGGRADFAVDAGGGIRPAVLVVGNRRVCRRRCRRCPPCC